MNLGARYEDTEQYAKALVTYTKAIEIAENYELLTFLGIAYYNRANCYAKIELYSQSENDYQRALNLAVDVANTKLQDAIRHNLGETYRRQGRLDESASLLLISLEFAQQHNNIDDQIRTLNNLGLAYEAQLNSQSALNSFEAALTLCSQHYRKRDEANVLISLGNFYMEAHQPDQAKSYYEQALAAARLAEDTDMEEGAVLSLAYAHRQLGTFNQIEEDFKVVAERASELHHYGNLIKFLTLAGQINLLDEKEPDAAATLFEQALIRGVMLGYSRAKQFIEHTEQPALVPELMEILGQLCIAIEDALRSEDSILARSFYDALLLAMQNRVHWRESSVWIMNYLTPIRSYLDILPEKSLWAYIVSALHKETMAPS